MIVVKRREKVAVFFGRGNVRCEVSWESGVWGEREEKWRDGNALAFLLNL